MPRPQTPRRPTDDDPLRRTPARSPRPARPTHTTPMPMRPNRSRDTPSRPAQRRADGGGGGRGGGGFVGLLKFLVFALVLAAIVLVVALTALRPVVNARSWLGRDNPAALQLPFVADIVARGPRAGADDPASRPDPGRVRRRGRRHGHDDRGAARGRGPRRATGGRSSSWRSTGADRRAPAGRLHPAQEHDARPAGQRPARAAGGPVRRRSRCGPGLRLEQITAKLQTLAA